MKDHLETQTSDLGRTESHSKSDFEQGSVEALLVETGVAALTAASKVSAQEAALQALAAAAVDLPPLRRALLRDQTVQALKRAGFESPARLVDVALPRSGSGEPTARSGSDVSRRKPGAVAGGC